VGSTADSPEQRLLSSKDLDCTGRLLGQVDQAAGMGDEARPHELPHQHCQVGSHGRHAALEVVKQLAAVLTQLDDLQNQAASSSWLAVLQPAASRRQSSARSSVDA